MRWTPLILALSLMTQPAIILAEDSCGDDAIQCESDETCSEHIVATFAKDHPAAPAYIVGKCVPKEQKGYDFWCGNRHCEGTFFGTPTVCCVQSEFPGAVPQYACASSELSCPGNTQQLSIRESQPFRTLRRG